MGTAYVNPVELLIEIIKEHNPEDIWLGSPLLGYRNLGNTNRGQIGEEFVRLYLKEAEIPVAFGGRTSLGLIPIALVKSEIDPAGFPSSSFVISSTHQNLGVLVTSLLLSFSD